MGLFDKVGSFLKREAKDLGDAADDVRDKFDHELSKRERELEMTPSEKIAALQQQAAANDAKFDTIADKAMGRDALADAVAEVGSIPRDPSLPNVTHIVLPDGRVKSGNDAEQVVDAAGVVHAVPIVEAPSAADLQKFDDVPEPPSADIAAPTPVTDQLPEPPAPAPVPAPVTELPEPPAPAPAPVTEQLPEPPAPAPVPAPVTEQLPEPPAPAPVPAPVTELPEPPAPAPAPVPAPVTEQLPEPPAPAPVPAPVTELPEPPAPAPAPVTEVAAALTEPDAPAEAAPSVVDPSSPNYGKSPAQLKYERARAAANDLLDELRGELKDDGAI